MARQVGWMAAKEEKGEQLGKNGWMRNYLSFPICRRRRRQQPRRRRRGRLEDVGRGGGRHGRRVAVLHRDRQSLLRCRSRRRRDSVGRGWKQCPAAAAAALGLGFKMSLFILLGSKQGIE